jgi:ABC-type uncharacterized transport system substrate-binding protein
MKRRTFIAGLGSAAAWPLTATAQQRAMPLIGFLDGGSFEARRETVVAVHRGLFETGYIEGRNLTIEYRWAENRLDRLPALAADLIRRKVAVIVAPGSTASVFAARAATTTIPIAFSTGVDPVEAGLVASLNRPGGNLTGISTFSTTMVAKRLELLHELVPAARLIACLINPTNTVFSEGETRELEVAALSLGVRLLILKASSQSEFATAFATLVLERAGGLFVGGDLLFLNQADQLVALAADHRVPAVYPNRKQAVAGGLMTYGTDLSEAWRQVGVYAGRIIKGEKPGDLPVQQVTKGELVINMKTAKALGLTFPLTLLGRADEVIE